MVSVGLRKKGNYDFLKYGSKSIGMLSIIFLSMAGLTVFQDFLESIRRGSSFYISESILFKTIWILFIPILASLSRVIRKQKLDSIGKTTFFIIAPIAIHLFILPFVFLLLSILFYNGRYDMNKILTYTLANDLYKLVIIYSVFVLIHKYFFHKLKATISLKENPSLKKIIIGTGKSNTIIEVNDIYQIKAESPYISVQLEEKKYLHTETLKSIALKLDDKTFIRVHKSTIVNLNKVVSFKSRLNGDYDIFLKNGIEIRLSRTYVANFKSNFRNLHRVTM